MKSLYKVDEAFPRVIFYPSIEFLRDRRNFATIFPSVHKFGHWKKASKLYARNARIVRKIAQIAKQQIARIEKNIKKSVVLILFYC